MDGSPTAREFYGGRPPSQSLKDVAGRLHDLHVTHARVLGTTPRTSRRTILEERFIGNIEYLMVDVNNPNVEIYLRIDGQNHRVTIQQLIDTGIDERVSGSFYLTLQDTVAPRYVALFNPQIPEPVRDRVIFDVTNVTSGPAVDVNLNSYRYRYRAQIDLRD